MTAALAPDTRIACADIRLPDRFHPPTGRRHLTEATQTARAYCAGCPTIDACRRAANHGREQGLWAGELRHIDGQGVLHTTHLLAIGQPTTTRKVTNP